jgi:hypothetical protein
LVTLNRNASSADGDFAIAGEPGVVAAAENGAPVGGERGVPNNDGAGVASDAAFGRGGDGLVEALLTLFDRDVK